MASYTNEVGSKPLLIGQYGVSIDTAISLTLPTTAQLTSHGGILEVVLSVETQNARIRFDGGTPTTVNGILLSAPGVLTIRGYATIANIQIIGVAAGGILNYGFTLDAMV